MATFLFSGIDDKYFTSPDVIDRVPDLLLYLSLLYAVVLTIAFFMVTLPPSDDPIDDKETGVINNLKDFLKIFA